MTRAALLGLAVALLAGCLYSRHTTHTGRSATEQLLLTESIERAVARLELPAVSGRAVALDVVSLAPEPAAYLDAALRRRLEREGAHVVPAGQAELLLAVRAGALGTVARDLGFGLPSLPLPSGGATPSLPVFRVLKQRAYTRLRLSARGPEGRHLAESDPVMDRASFEVYSFLFLALRRNDIYPGEEVELAID